VADQQKPNSIERMNGMLESYANDLRKLIFEKRKFSIPPFYSLVFPIYREVLFLERLICQNNIEGSEGLWKKYEKKYEETYAEQNRAIAKVFKDAIRNKLRSKTK
jgi:hypothetical protein